MAIVFIAHPIYTRTDPDIFLRVGLTENWLVFVYDTLISGFQWMLAVYKKSQHYEHEAVSTFRSFTFNSYQNSFMYFFFFFSLISYFSFILFFIFLLFILNPCFFLTFVVKKMLLPVLMLTKDRPLYQ